MQTSTIPRGHWKDRHFRRHCTDIKWYVKHDSILNDVDPPPADTISFDREPTPVRSNLAKAVIKQHIGSCKNDICISFQTKTYQQSVESIIKQITKACQIQSRSQYETKYRITSDKNYDYQFVKFVIYEKTLYNNMKKNTHYRNSSKIVEKGKIDTTTQKCMTSHLPRPTNAPK